MKPTNIGLIFAFVFLCLVIILDSRFNDLNTITNLQIRYNYAVDNAIEAAMDRLVEVDNGVEKRLNKEEAVECFNNSLAINFDVIDQKNLREKLKGYVPVIAIILEDGFYIYYDKEQIELGYKVIKKEFSEKFQYEYEDNNLILYFTLTDYVRIVDKNNREYYEGDYHDLAKVFPHSIMKDDVEYERIRRTTIINMLTEAIELYINEHNKIANHYGITYHFALPNIELEDWYRTIDDISMIAFFQGYPYGNTITDKYNRVALAGARIHKEEQ